MSKYGDNDYPANWHDGIGEAARPLADGGYYDHRYYRVLVGSNQHTEHYLELHVDTIGIPPSEHSIQLHYCIDDGQEIRRVELLETDTVAVETPANETSQEDAEQSAHDLALEWMDEYSDYRPTHGS